MVYHFSPAKLQFGFRVSPISEQTQIGGIPTQALLREFSRPWQYQTFLEGSGAIFGGSVWLENRVPT